MGAVAFSLPVFSSLHIEPDRCHQEKMWSWAALIGRLTEITGLGASAALTMACALVLEAQCAGEPVAWITRMGSAFYPPDAGANGVDLDALVVVRTPDAPAAAYAGDVLARSGAFGLIVLDLGGDAIVPMAVQTRLAGLTQRHGLAVVCLTEKPSAAPSLSSLISLRAETRRQHISGDQFLCTIEAQKDKRHGP